MNDILFPIVRSVLWDRTVIGGRIVKQFKVYNKEDDIINRCFFCLFVLIIIILLFNNVFIANI